LSVGVWGPGNEKVIEEIQSLGEAHMAELMRSIEEVSVLPRQALIAGNDNATCSRGEQRE
jgi:hypothetical protein